MVSNRKTRFVSSALLAGLVIATANCGMADEPAEDGEAAASEAKAPVVLDVGGEARDGVVMTAGRFSLVNAYVLEQVSNAAYESDKPEKMYEVLCGAGMEAEEHPCTTPGDRVRVKVTQFDSDGDNHAIYIEGEKFGVAAFRGTASARNFLTDFAFRKTDFAEFGKGNPKNHMEIHRGFDASTRRVFQDVLPGRSQSMRDYVLERHRKSEKEPLPRPLYVTGHSLGGAMATVAVASLLLDECTAFAETERFADPRADVPSDELRWSAPGTHCPATSSINIQALYTYGSPRVGNKHFAEAIANLMALRHIAHWRVVHEEDLIALVPPRDLGYSHLHIDMRGIPERRGNGTFDLREDENVAIEDLPKIKGGRCFQKPGDDSSPKACPISSWVFLIPDSEGRTLEERELSKLLRVGMGAKQFVEKEKEANGSGNLSLNDHYLKSYDAVLGRLARREKRVVTPSKACEDTADTIAEAAPRCGGEPEAARAAFIATVSGGGDCSNIKTIKDTETFYGKCLPHFATISCDDWIAGRLHRDCLGQLSR